MKKRSRVKAFDSDYTSKMILFFLDLSLGLFAFFTSFSLFTPYDPLLGNFGPFNIFAALAVVMTFYHMGAFLYMELYRYKIRLDALFFKQLSKIFLGEVFCFLIFVYFLDIFFFYHFVFFYLVFNYFLMIMLRVLLFHFLNFLYPVRKGCTRYVVTYGIKSRVDLNHFRTDSYERIVEVAKIPRSAEGKIKRFIIGLLRQRPIDQIFVGTIKDLKVLHEIVAVGESSGIPVSFDLSSFSRQYFNASLTTRSDTTLLNFEYHRLTETEQTLKRIMDVFISFFGCSLTLLFYPFIAALIKLDSTGPVLYSQKRVGRFGHEFNILKFRTMTADADEQKSKLKRLNERKGPMFKLKNDPRMTRVGRILRKTKLDELPQFFNVFRGEMSLVGTRPPSLDEVVTYKLSFYKRLTVRPGMTGEWQICDKSSLKSFQDVIELDFNYFNNWTLGKDIQILFRTFFYVFKFEES